MADLTPAQRRYQNIATLPIYVAALTWFVTAILAGSPSLSSEYAPHVGRILAIVTGVFIADLVIQFILDPQKATFIKRTWPLIICLFIPLLRVVFVFAAIRRIQHDRNSLAKTVGLIALYAVLFVVLVGSAVVLAFERGGSGRIQSYGDAVWWGLETVTTVGYGDFTPVTVAGRVVAAVIMFSGAAAVGALTAVLASRFVASASRVRTDDGAESTSTPNTPQASSDSSVSQQLATLRDRIEHLTSLIEGGGEARRGG